MLCLAMVNWQAVIAISTILTFLVLGASLAVAYFHLRTVRKENRIDRLVRETNKYDSKEFQESLVEIYDLAFVGRNLQVPNMDAIAEPANMGRFYGVFNYFEKLAILCQENVVDKDLTYNLMGDMIVHYWNDLGRCIDVWRRMEENPHIFEKWENLAIEFRGRRDSD
jgi:uncharacterized protein YfkK (UPF0435 family)